MAKGAIAGKPKKPKPRKVELESLVLALQGQSSAEDGSPPVPVESAARMLWGLVLDPNLCGDVIEEGALQPLCKILKDGPTYARTYAVGGLGCLALHNEEAKVAILGENVLPTLVQYFDACGNTDAQGTSQSTILRCLGSLAETTDKDAAEQIARSVTKRAITSLLDYEKWELQDGAASCLQRLTRLHSTHAEVLTLGGTRALVEVMRSARLATTRGAMPRVILQLLQRPSALEVERMAAELSEAGAIQLLIEFLPCGPHAAALNISDAAVSATGVLWALSRLAQHRGEVGAAVPQLVHMLQNGPTNEAKIWAGGALWMLSLEDAHKATLAALNLPPVLVALLKSKDPVLRERAVAILRNLADDPAARTAIVAAGPPEHLLDVWTHEPFPPLGCEARAAQILEKYGPPPHEASAWQLIVFKAKALGSPDRLPFLQATRFC